MTLPRRTRVYGVDFSGAREAGHKIWIAQAVVHQDTLCLERCAAVATLLGVAPQREACLSALCAWIAREQEAVFGLDFPFGLPAPLLEAASWEEFVRTFPERYATPQHFRSACYAAAEGRELKRLTDHENDTPWASYNLRLYRQTFYGISALLAPLVSQGAVSVLPMQRPRSDRAWLIEICPAATLKRHDLYMPYKGREARHRRARRDILEAVQRLAPLRFADAALQNTIIQDGDGDALDSVIAAWATWRALQRSVELEKPFHPLYVREGYVYY
ncbi:MAG: DUF429 domain-containing protein [Anaerolineae bacterium]|nr:DUF429 domain-containing protein [Anaerolineae bacterium]MDW8072193.1 DUF429 domain-containing protein [Anaerolineae bacterium]